jgi:Family of unknown function (DUF6502)
MSQNSLEQTLQTAVIAILRPLVRLLLRNGMPYGTFTELAKWVYVDVASRDFSLAERKQSASRVSVITGLNRKEVARMQSLSPLSEHEHSAEEYNRAARVVAGWVRDYPDTSGEGTRILPFAGEKNSFTQLVKRYSGDMPARAVLDELIAMGTVVREADGNLRLTARLYVPRGMDVTKLTVLGQDVSDLIAAIDHNLNCKPELVFVQRTVISNNVSSEAAEILRADATGHAQALLDYQHKQLAKYDRDVVPDVGGTGRKRVTLGVYFFAEDFVAETVQPVKPKKKSSESEPAA